MYKTLMIVPFIFLCFLGTAQRNSFRVELSGSGQPVILIPGYSCSGDVWSETVQQLKGKYECHVLTLPGYDGVMPIDSPVLKTVKNELVAYIREHHLKNAILIGHSLGGFLSLWAGSELGESVSKIIIVDGLPAIAAMQNPQLNYDSLRISSSMNAAKIISNFKSIPNEQYINYASRAMHAQVSDSNRVKQIAGWGYRCDRQTLATTFLEMTLTDLRPELNKITCPVLIIASKYGSEDRSRLIMNQQYANLKNKRIDVADSKHFIMYDAPEFLYREIEEFLKK